MNIAIDPGAHGGIAWCEPAINLTQATGMPETRGDTIALIRKILNSSTTKVVCFHEKVANFIPDGGASQMMAFGRSAERCACIMETLGVPLIEIAPKDWQKLLGLGASERVSVPRMPKSLPKEEAKTWKEANTEFIKTAKAHNAKAKRDWKTKLKAEAQRRYPGINVTLATADALLILSASFRYEGTQR